MKTDILLKKLYLDGKEFVTARELKAYCRLAGLDYETAVRHLVPRGRLVRIFRGIFYLKSLEEIELGRARYDYLSLVAKGIELKGVKTWYYGLHTALKLNNMTHEHFSIDEVVSDSLFRAAPIKIAGYAFRFLKLAPGLFGFGVNEGARIRYSDPEKTLLDFMYVWRYNGVAEDRIMSDISEWAGRISRKKLKAYAERYTETVKKMAGRM